MRRWSAISLDVSCPIDIVPALSERALKDPDIRVRRMAVIMLGSELLDARAVPVLEHVVEVASDRKLRDHAM